MNIKTTTNSALRLLVALAACVQIGAFLGAVIALPFAILFGEPGPIGIGGGIGALVGFFAFCQQADQA